MFDIRKTPCTVNKTVWEEDRSRFNCTSSINVYHCIQDERNRSGEICIQSVWVQKNYCPEFNTGANALDTVPCNGSIGCPNVTFLSAEVYKYPICLNKTMKEEFTEDGTNFLFWLWIVLTVFLVILLLTICYIVRRRKQCFRKNEDEESLKLLKKDFVEPFHKTRAFHEAVSFIKNGGRFLILTGQWGSGKTSVAKHVYTEVTGRSPIIIRDFTEFDVNKHQQPIIFDEAISGNPSETEKEDLEKKINSWCERINSKEQISGNVSQMKKMDSKEKINSSRKSMNPDETIQYIIFTSIDADYVTGLPDEEKKVINISKSLTKGDRTQILHSHFEYYFPNKDFSKIEKVALKCKYKSLGYPEICALFCRYWFLSEKRAFLVFSQLPLRYLKSHLQKMYHSENRDKFLLLVFMSLNQMEIDDQYANEMLFEILETCKTCKHRKEDHSTEISKHESTGIEEATKTMEDNSSGSTKSKSVKCREDKEFVISLIPSEFVDKVPGTSTRYRLQHDVIKRMTLVVFGTCHFDKLLRFSKQEDLKGWIEESSIMKTLKDSQSEIRPVLYVDKKQWEAYMEKLEDNSPTKDI